MPKQKADRAQREAMETKVQLHLEIDQDDSVPFPLVQIALPEVEEGSAFIRIVASNFKSSDDGARAVASLLENAAGAIRSKLGEQDKPKRPRFNPRPVGGQ